MDEWERRFDELRAPLASASPPPVLYHYTSVDAFRSILDTQSLWFTNVAYMNDEGEEIHVVNVISDAVRDVCDELGYDDHIGLVSRVFQQRFGLDFYALSLSERDDDLGQWRGYGHGIGGIAIGLSCDGLKPAGRSRIEVVKIDYDRPSQISEIADITRRFLGLYNELKDQTPKSALARLRTMLFRYLGADLTYAALRYKSRHWVGESEWRLIIARHGPEANNDVKFRTGPIGLTPYIAIELRQAAGGDADKLPIGEAVIGPCRYPALAKRAVTKLLSQKGWPRDCVRQSTVPLRF